MIDSPKVSRIIITILNAFCFVHSATMSAGASPTADSPPHDSTHVITSQSRTTPGTASVTTREISDGRGHIRMESTVATTSGAHHSTLIWDYPNKQMITLLIDQKMYTIYPLTQDEVRKSAPWAEPKYRRVPLGVKMVDGHLCHGWRIDMESNYRCECWIADDIQECVRSTSVGPDGTSTMVLKSYSRGCPPGTQFTVPPGFKDQTAMMRQIQSGNDPYTNPAYGGSSGGAYGGSASGSYGGNAGGSYGGDD